MKIRMAYSVSCLLLPLTLAACGGGAPSEKDIADAFAYQMKQATNNLKATAANLGASSEQADDLTPQIHGVKKIGCKAATGADGYVCDVQIDVTTPLAGRQTRTSTVRLVRGSDGWRVVKE